MYDEHGICEKCGYVTDGDCKCPENQRVPDPYIEVLERIVCEEVDPCLLGREGRKLWQQLHKKFHPENY